MLNKGAKTLVQTLFEGFPVRGPEAQTETQEVSFEYKGAFFFPVRVAEHCYTLLSEVVESPFLEIPGNLDMVLVSQL